MTKEQRTVSRASLTIIAAVLAVFAVVFGVLGFIAVGTEQALAWGVEAGPVIVVIVLLVVGVPLGFWWQRRCPPYKQSWVKLYWAILTTIGLLAAACAIDVLIAYQIGGERVIAPWALVILSAIWVASDSGSFGWGLFVLLLWIIGFPMYLFQRRVVRVTKCPACGASVTEGDTRCPSCKLSFE